MSTKSNGDANATRGGDASVVRDSGGDRAAHTISANVDSIRNEPGQGLNAEKDRISKTDVTSMGFPDTKLADASGGRGISSQFDLINSKPDAAPKADNGEKPGAKPDAAPGKSDGVSSQFDLTKGEKPAPKPGADGKSDPHACFVKPGAQPDETGKASIYNERERTSTGGWNDPKEHTAAHKTLPIGSKVCVTRPGESKGTEVTINDRGPYVKGRILDMTPAATKDIGFTDGVKPVHMYKPGQYEKTR